jgi:DHA2 family multidrug resistance protein-like MFS transporter
MSRKSSTSTKTAMTPEERRKWIAVAVLMLPCMIVVMDLTVLFLAVPELTADLQPTSTELLWITDIYGFLVAGTLITMGTLGDRIGRRRLLLSGSFVFAVASVFAAVSSSPEMLIVARGVQGIAGATLVPSIMAIAYQMFTEETDRQRAVGIIMSGFAAGAALGPLAGGALLEFFSWNSVFFINVPVMVALLVVGPRLLPEYKNPDGGRVDVVSAVLSVFAMLGIVYGIKEMARHGVDGEYLVSLGGGLVLIGAFFYRQTKLENPMVDLSLFRSKVFNTSLGSAMVGALTMYGMFLFTSQYLQLGLGYTPLEAGLWGLPGIVVMMVAAGFVPELVKHVRQAYAIAGGLALTALGFALLTVMSPSDGVWLIVLATTVMSLGIAPSMTLGTNLIMGSVPPERSGNASALAETGNELGGALGIALLGSLGTAVYRSDMSDAVPASVPSEAASSAKDTLGGAADVAGSLPTSVFNAAQSGFVEAINWVAAVNAGLTLVAAIACAVFLRHIGGGEAPVGETESAPAERERLKVAAEVA